MADDYLDDFERTTFTHAGKTRLVFRKGSGPAVLVMAEMPGITPKVAAVAREIADIGCSAVMPHLFGRPGKDPISKRFGAAGSVPYMLSSIVPACVSREFTVLALGKSSPVVDWLRALGKDEHHRCGGPGIGAVGMCFTGGYALSMAVDQHLLAPVLSQPSMPVGKKGRRQIDISPADLDTVAHRCAHEDLKVLGLRFKSDRLVPQERFDLLRERLGDAFIAFELDDEAANTHAVMAPHSVLTEHLIDAPGEPTRAAFDAMLELFRTTLLDEHS